MLPIFNYCKISWVTIDKKFRFESILDFMSKGDVIELFLTVSEDNIVTSEKDLDMTLYGYPVTLDKTKKIESTN